MEKNEYKTYMDFCKSGMKSLIATRGGNANYGVLKKLVNEELYLTTRKSKSCYGGLKHEDIGQNAVLLLPTINFGSQRRKDETTGLYRKYDFYELKTEKKVAIVFYDWLFNRSPYSKIFVEKDAKKILKRRYFAVDPNYPSNLVVGGMIVGRNIWEYYDRVKLWYNVRDKVNENLAYALIWQVDCLIDSSYIIRKTPYSYEHTPFGNNLYSGEVKNIVSNNPVKLNKNFSKDHIYNRPCSIHHMFKIKTADKILNLNKYVNEDKMVKTLVTHDFEKTYLYKLNLEQITEIFKKVEESLEL